MANINNPIFAASAVIFDVDGTLVDSVDFHAEAWQRAFVAFGYDFELTKFREQIGKGGDQLMPAFLDADALKQHGMQIDAYRQDLFEREYFPRVVGFPKVPELFRMLIDAGKAIALGSSAKSEDLKKYKKAAGIDGLTAVETASDDAERSKPYPDIFLAALDRLNRPASEVIVVGDTPYDVEASRKAGMKAIGLLCGGFSERSLREAGAVQVYRDPAHLLELLEEANSGQDHQNPGMAEQGAHGEQPHGGREGGMSYGYGGPVGSIPDTKARTAVPVGIEQTEASKTETMSPTKGCAR